MFAVDPIRDAGSLAGVGEARLDVSPAYMSIAPISSILDTLTLLTVGQHIALLLWVIGVFVVWRVARARGRRTTLAKEGFAVIALLLGWGFMGEQLTPWMLAGTVLVVLSVSGVLLTQATSEAPRRQRLSVREC